MNQEEALKSGKQGVNLYQGGSFKGGNPPINPGSDKQNDLHASGEAIAGNHSHRNVGIDAAKDPKSFTYLENPDALANRSNNLVQSKYNKKRPYNSPI